MITLKWSKQTHMSCSFGGLMKMSAVYRLRDGHEVTCLYERFTPKKSEFVYGKPEIYFGIEGDEDLELETEGALHAHLQALEEAIPIVYLNVNGQTNRVPHLTPELLSELQKLIEQTKERPFVQSRTA